MKCWWCEQEIKGEPYTAFIVEGTTRKGVDVCEKCFLSGDIEDCDYCGLPFICDYLRPVFWGDVEGSVLCETCFEANITAECEND